MAAFCFDGEYLACGCVRRDKFRMFFLYVCLVFIFDFISSSNAGCRNEQFISCSLELVFVLQPSNNLCL